MLERRGLTGGQIVRLRNRETAIAFTLNASVSAILCAAIFGTSGQIPTRGLSAFPIDFVPHSFMTILVGTLIPGLIARRAAIRGGSADHVPRKRAVLRFGVLRAARHTPVLLAVVAAGLWVVAGPEIPAAAAILLKFIYGGVLAGAVTPAAVYFGLGVRPFGNIRLLAKKDCTG